MNRLLFTILLWLIGFQSQAAAPNSQADFLKAIAGGNVEQVREMLKTDSTLAEATAPGGTSALLYALYHRQSDIAGLLLPYRESDLTIFESAAVGDTTRLQTLLRGDPKLVNAVSTDGFTPLHLASFFGQASSQEVLIRTGAKLETHSRNPLNATPLQSAVAARQTRSVAVLLAHGADPNCRGEAGYTPLFEAAESGQVDVLLLLLKHGADRSIRGTDGKTALDVAIEAHQAKVQELLSKGKV
jgi:ankyrin repeat protein